MGPPEKRNLRNMLIVKNGLSSNTLLYPCDSADSNDATIARAKWITSSWEMNLVVTDEVTHSKSSLMNKLTARTHIKHHFTTAYCPWSNGTVERVCKKVPQPHAQYYLTGKCQLGNSLP